MCVREAVGTPSTMMLRSICRAVALARMLPTLDHKLGVIKNKQRIGCQKKGRTSESLDKKGLIPSREGTIKNVTMPYATVTVAEASDALREGDQLAGSGVANGG